MGRRKCLLIKGLIVLATTLGVSAVLHSVSSVSAATTVPGDDLGWTGEHSSGHLTENGAEVEVTSPGDDGGSDPDEGWVPPEGWFLCNDSWRPPEERATAICRDPITVTGPPVPTLNDVREFFPAETALTSEPAGWAVRNLPTNFVAPATTHQSTGTVLGLPTEVKFAPIAVRWDYGDGTTVSTFTGGATWHSLGQRRFTDTATSHTYRSRGEYDATATVDYTVTYRFGGGVWRPIDGTLSIPLPAASVRVVSGSTVLTDGPCAPQSASSC